MKLLTLSDYSQRYQEGIQTGFGRQHLSILTYLHSRGHQVHEVGCGYVGQLIPEPAPWPVYSPTAYGRLEGQDCVPRLANQIGVDAVLLLADIPDVAWLADPLNYHDRRTGQGMSGEMVAHIEAGVWKKIAYTVLDSVAPNFHLPQWGPIFAGFDAVAMPTKWSCDVVEQNFGLRPTYLPHMYDPNQFKPGDKRQARSRFGIDPEAFLILGVGVNRKRKMIPAWFETVAKFAAKAPQGSKILFWAHINSIPDDPGYDLKALADHYELERYGVQAVNTQRLPEAVYPEALKAADVVIHLTGGEGAGVVPMEAAACRIPSFVTAYTGQTEHVPDIADNFLKIPPKALIPQPGNVVMWAWPDTDIAAERMLEYFSNATLRTKIKRATFEHIQKFKSDVVLPKFEKWLEDTIAMQQTEHLTVEVV